VGNKIALLQEKTFGELVAARGIAMVLSLLLLRADLVVLRR